MLQVLKSLFTRKIDTPIAPVDIIPAHKGFVASVALKSGYKQTAQFATLEAAQRWIHESIRETRKCYAILEAHGRRPMNAARTYAIRNLETGRFAPYQWQVAI